MVKFYTSPKRSDLRLQMIKGLLPEWILAGSMVLCPAQGSSTEQEVVLYHVWTGKTKGAPQKCQQPQGGIDSIQKSLLHLGRELRDRSLWTRKAPWSEKGNVKVEHDVEQMVRDLWDFN